MKMIFSMFLLILYILLDYGKVTEARSDSCPVSRNTVKVVESCPETEQEWMKAAAKKNCSHYVKQCDEPNRLKYHCLINPFSNQTLEVCAYKQHILYGHCAEYSISGNLVQGNRNATCANFTHLCPMSYNSTDAYKYQECYPKKTTKASTQEIQLQTTTPLYNYSGAPEGQEVNKENNAGRPVPTYIVSVLCSMLCGLLSMQ